MSKHDNYEKNTEVGGEEYNDDEREKYLKIKTMFLRFSLINAIAVTLGINVEDCMHRSLYGRSFIAITSCKGEQLEETSRGLTQSLVTLIKWIERPSDIELSDEYAKGVNNLPIKEHVVDTMKIAIIWAAKSSPEENVVLKRVFKDSLFDALNWVRNFGVTYKEDKLKEILAEPLINAISSASNSCENNDYMRKILFDYTQIIYDWTNSIQTEECSEKYTDSSLDRVKVDERGPSKTLASQDILDSNIKKSSEPNMVDGVRRNELGNNALEERLSVRNSLVDFSKKLKTLKINQDGEVMKDELLDIINIAIKLTTNITSKNEEEIFKHQLAQTLLVSVNWLMSNSVNEDEDTKQQIIESLMFAINWANSSEGTGENAIIKQLLRHVLATSLMPKGSFNRNKLVKEGVELLKTDDISSRISGNNKPELTKAGLTGSAALFCVPAEINEESLKESICEDSIVTKDVQENINPKTENSSVAEKSMKTVMDDTGPAVTRVSQQSVISTLKLNKPNLTNLEFKTPESPAPPLAHIVNSIMRPHFLQGIDHITRRAITEGDGAKDIYLSKPSNDITASSGMNVKSIRPGENATTSHGGVVSHSPQRTSINVLTLENKDEGIEKAVISDINEYSDTDDTDRFMNRKDINLSKELKENKPSPERFTHIDNKYNMTEKQGGVTANTDKDVYFSKPENDSTINSEGKIRNLNIDENAMKRHIGDVSEYPLVTKEINVSSTDEDDKQTKSVNFHPEYSEKDKEIIVNKDTYSLNPANNNITDNIDNNAVKQYTGDISDNPQVTKMVNVSNIDKEDERNRSGNFDTENNEKDQEKEITINNDEDNYTLKPANNSIIDNTGKNARKQYIGSIFDNPLVIKMINVSNIDKEDESEKSGNFGRPTENSEKDKEKEIIINDDKVTYSLKSANNSIINSEVKFRNLSIDENAVNNYVGDISARPQYTKGNNLLNKDKVDKIVRPVSINTTDSGKENEMIINNGKESYSSKPINDGIINSDFDSRRLSTEENTTEKNIRVVSDNLQNTKEVNVSNTGNEYGRVETIKNKSSNEPSVESENKEIQDFWSALNNFSNAVKNIKANKDGKFIKNELVDIFDVTINMIPNITSKNEIESLKQQLSYPLIFSKNWMITSDLDEDQDVKEQVLETLNSAIEWATRNVEEGENLAVRQLGRHTLAAAIEDGIRGVDRKEENKSETKNKFVKRHSKLSQENESNAIQSNNKRSYSGTVTDKKINIADLEKSHMEDCITYEDRFCDTTMNNSEEGKMNPLHELKNSLEDIFLWISSIRPNKYEQIMKKKMLEELSTAIQLASNTKLNKCEEDAMKYDLEEILRLSLDWAMSMDEAESGNIKRQLMDSVIFSMNWNSASQPKKDAGITQLLRRSITTARSKSLR